MRYVITGGSGFIGSHIAEELAGSHEVVVIDNFFSGRRENLAGIPVQVVEGSITDPALLKTVFRDADGIFHEAAIASVPRSIRNPHATNEANVTGTLNVLMAAKECGVPSLVFASSSSVYGDTPTLPKHEDMAPNPRSPYAVSKLTGEYYCRVFSDLFAVRTVCLRYFNVFGPRQDPASEYAAVIPRFVTSILRRESPVIFGDGKQTRDFTYVKDVARANIRAMESSASGVYNIAYGTRIDLITLAETIMEETGHRVPIRFAPAREGDVRDSLADITKARRDFGYSPGYTVASGLRKTIEWYRGRT